MRRYAELLRWLPLGILVYIVAFRVAPRSLWGGPQSASVDLLLMVMCFLGVPAAMTILVRSRRSKSLAATLVIGLMLDGVAYVLAHLKLGTPIVDPGDCSREDYAAYMQRIDRCRARDWGMMMAHERYIAMKGPALRTACAAFADAHRGGAAATGDDMGRVTRCGQPAKWTKVTCGEGQGDCYTCEWGLDPKVQETLVFSADCATATFLRIEGVSSRFRTWDLLRFDDARLNRGI